MAEPTRRIRLDPPAERGYARDAYALDVLLIADDPRKPEGPGFRRSGRRAIAAGRVESMEPFDMETVVRKLIAVLNDETKP